jgi:hypothetical protein
LERRLDLVSGKEEGLIERMPPAEIRKSRVISVGRHPFGTRLYGKCREIGIWNQVATSARDFAEADKYFPVAWPRGDGYAIEAIPNLSDESDGNLKRGRLPKNTRVSYDSEEAGQNKIRHAIGRITVDNVRQPVSITPVAR